MNPLLEEIYSTIIPSAPFLIASYALIWLALLVFVFIMMRSMKKTQRQLMVIEEALVEKGIAFEQDEA